MKFLTASLITLLAGVVISAAAQPTSSKSPKSPSTEKYDTGYDTRKHITIAVTRYAEAHAALTGFIRARALRLHKQEEAPEQLTADFGLATRDLARLDSLAGALGMVLENNLNTYDLTPQQQTLRAEEQSLTLQLTALNEDMRAATGKEKKDFRAQIDIANNRLLVVREQMADLAGHTGQTFVTLRLFDEVSFPTGNRRVSFVNMPGVEYGMLRLDNPQPGLTAQVYQGYAIKYLFTRGKSYLNLGVYKPVTKQEGSEFVDELFVINFGQDFYPRNFGRGRRRYLNLYSSYQLGGFILNQQGGEKNEFIPNLNLGLGVELLKTRHILIDTKGSYFIPLHQKSRELRGLLGQASFNFVF
jgi:hypothetical protein